MRIIMFGAIAAVVLHAGGCSTTPKSTPIFAESFIASVTDEGLKQFNYEATLAGNGGGAAGQRRAPPRGGQGGPRGQGTMPGGGMSGGMSGGMGRGKMDSTRKDFQRDPEQTVTTRLEEIMESSAFCEHGFFVIKKEIEAGHAQVFGECKSSSSDKAKG